jgi:hypothetical protein
MLLTYHGGHFHVHGHVYYVVGDIYRVHIYFNHALMDIYIYIYIYIYRRAEGALRDHSFV